MSGAGRGGAQCCSRTAMRTLLLELLLLAAATALPHAGQPAAVEEFLLPREVVYTSPDSWFGGLPPLFNFFNFNTGLSDFIARMNPFGEDISELISKGNTTSETKVVNGTVITRNTTTYIDDELGTVVHVSSVDIRPSDKTPGQPEAATTPAGNEPESTEQIDADFPQNAADIDMPDKESNEISNDKVGSSDP
ncbi:uncharacterized protein LOC134538075 [Bacillus rossius redtenbacheri]|uniref:uncharacterized protein LOC134538075 n=1 Tax=Bacillus rossius redtenbacheri TaxID=93214 RepID=UPI002FDDA5B4